MIDHTISRRQFFTRALAALAGTVVVPKLFGDYTALSPHRFALLADPHVNAPGTLYFDNQLRRVVNQITSCDPLPLAAFVVGDLAYMSGLIQDYPVFSEITERIEAAGIALPLALGNHDIRENYWRTFPERKRPLPDHHVALLPAKRANFFVLDSLDVGSGTDGRCGDAQLRWLAHALDAHPDLPAITMVHHHPGGLRDYEAFFNVILPRRQVKAHFYGHLHRWEVGSRLGIHLIGLPSTAYGTTGWVDMTLEPDRACLQLCTLDPQPAIIPPLTLNWR